MEYLVISESVREALAWGMPVVALESTIISHGMPWPRNMETALEVEDEIRKAGAVPATTAIIDGKMRAGLDHASIERIAKAGHSAVKVSRRDFPRLLAEGGTGATTVAATMIIAERAGIKVFATGGVGGVHRGAETTWDVSADLEELAKTSVAVICAGAKSILDLPKTLEYLETRGVPVIGYCTLELPAFYTGESGIFLEERADSPAQIAAMLRAKWGAGLSGGVLVANPIPPGFSMPRDLIEEAIGRAVTDAAAAGVSGKRLTPYLLARVVELTGGESLDSNIALVKNNARLAAGIAKEYEALCKGCS